MSEAVVTAPAGRGRAKGGAPVQFAVLFVLIGPLVGSLVFVTIAAVEMLAGGHVEHPGSYLANLIGGLPFVALLGYLVGSVPALVAGLLIGLLDRWLRGWLLYLAGLLISAAPSVVLALAGNGWRPIGWFTLVTAIATLACTALARHVGLGRT